MPDLAQPVHDPQALKRILAVEQPPVVHGAQIAFHVGAGQRRPAQDHRGVGQAPAVQFLKVVAHDQRGLHQQAAHPDGVGLHLGGGTDHLLDAHLDADVVDLVAVVGEDDVHQVLADVVHVAFDRGQHDPALAAVVGALHVGFEVGHGHLHGLGRLQHERQLHLTGGEQLTDDLHAAEQHVVDDEQRGEFGGHGVVEFVGESLAVAVDDALAESLLDGPVGAVFDRTRGHGDTGECFQQGLQRVVAGVVGGGGHTPVVDQVGADLALLVGDAGQRHDLAGMHDG